MRILLSALTGKLTSRQSVFAEDQLIWRYFNKSRRKGLMFDVGAHGGSSCLPYLKAGWKVHAFEPEPGKVRRLKRLGKQYPLKLHPYAVSDTAGKNMPFYTSEESTGISTLSPFRDTHRQTATVETITLAQVIEQGDIRSIDYLKVDTEGYDLMVLRGFPWDRIKPELVMCEFEDNKTSLLGYTTHELGEFLYDQNYDVYMSEWMPIVRYGVQHVWRSLRPYPCRCEDPKGWGNFIAVKRGEPSNRFRRIAGYYLKD